MTNQTVLALYDDRASAQQVLEELRAAGYGSEFSLSDGGSSSSAASGVSTASGGSIRFSITVAGPFLTKKASLILYVLRTCPVQIRPGKRHEAAI